MFNRRFEPVWSIYPFPTGYDREREERREERAQQERRDRDYDLPKKGNTIYVNGLGITEEILRKAFSNIGTILNINMERDKQYVFFYKVFMLFLFMIVRGWYFINVFYMTFVITDVLMFFSVGFVSFERMESADTAIAEVPVLFCCKQIFGQWIHCFITRSVGK